MTQARFHFFWSETTCKSVCVNLHHKYIFESTPREITLLCAFDHLSTSLHHCASVILEIGECHTLKYLILGCDYLLQCVHLSIGFFENFIDFFGNYSIYPRAKSIFYLESSKILFHQLQIFYLESS
jgi:hypothetical protein